MALLSRHSRTLAPRLAPELDDQALARTLKIVSAPVRAVGQTDQYLVVLEKLLREGDQDDDRRAFRLSLIAGHAETAIRKWRHESPNNPDALLLSAWSRLAAAKEAGAVGGGASRELDAALNDCRTAAELRPEDSVPWIAALGILRQQRRPWPEVEPVWRALRERDPWSRMAHLELLGYLSPEECGSQTAVLDFVGAVAAGAPAGSPVSALPLEAQLRRYHRVLAAGGVGAIGADEVFRQPTLTRLLECPRLDWPRPGFLTHAAALADLNLLAYALLHTASPQSAAPVFQRLGGVVTAWPWSIDGDPVERFTLWHRRLVA
jgi:hypothetical protein